MPFFFLFSQWHRDSCSWSNRWIIQTTWIQVVHVCDRRWHDAHTGPSSRQYRRHHTSTDNCSLSSLKSWNKLFAIYPLATVSTLVTLCRAAGVCLCSMQKWGEMRKASWKASRFRDWRTSWELDRCPPLSYCWTVFQLTWSVSQYTSLTSLQIIYAVPLISVIAVFNDNTVFSHTGFPLFRLRS